MPRPKPVTLPPITKPSQHAGAQWRPVRVLVEINCQASVTDKVFINWVREAVDLHQERHPIQDYVAPLRTSNPEVKSYARWAQSEQLKATPLRTRNKPDKPKPPPEGTTRMF